MVEQWLSNGPLIEYRAMMNDNRLTKVWGGSVIGGKRVDGFG